MARKYGLVNAHDVKVVQPGHAPNQANMRGGSIGGQMKRNNPMSTVSYPKMTRAGEAHWGGVVSHLTGRLMSGLQGRAEKQAASSEEARGSAMEQHPAMRSQSAVAARQGGSPIGGLRDRPGALSADAQYTAPKGMGAKVPPSRAEKFDQGRGL